MVSLLLRRNSSLRGFSTVYAVGLDEADMNKAQVRTDDNGPLSRILTDAGILRLGYRPYGGKVSTIFRRRGGTDLPTVRV